MALIFHYPAQEHRSNTHVSTQWKTQGRCTVKPDVFAWKDLLYTLAAEMLVWALQVGETWSQVVPTQSLSRQRVDGLSWFYFYFQTSIFT